VCDDECVLREITLWFCWNDKYKKYWTFEHSSPLFKVYHGNMLIGCNVWSRWTKMCTFLIRCCEKVTSLFWPSERCWSKTPESSRVEPPIQPEWRNALPNSLSKVYSTVSLSFPWSSVYFLHCALASCGAVYCNRSCLWVCVCVCLCVCLWVCYHDNSKLRASILTKLGL